MDWTDIITTILTVGGTIAVAYITHGLKKSTNQNSAEVLEKLKKVEETQKTQEIAAQLLGSKMSELSENLEDNNLRTLRLDLLHAIETDPRNKLVILELAQKYFVEMKGNCYMSKVFQEWANDNNVEITSIFNKG